MARPQVAEGDSLQGCSGCEYIQYVDENIRQGLVLQNGVGQVAKKSSQYKHN